jgi:hypothetical protein
MQRIDWHLFFGVLGSVVGDYKGTTSARVFFRCFLGVCFRDPFWLLEHHVDCYYACFKMRVRLQ